MQRDSTAGAFAFNTFTIIIPSSSDVYGRNTLFFNYIDQGKLSQFIYSCASIDAQEWQPVTFMSVGIIK